jgi:hypothetical protein
MDQTLIADRTFRIGDLVRDGGPIFGKTFVRCHIYGPAILAGIGTTKKTGFANPHFQTNGEPLFTPAPAQAPAWMVKLSDTQFRDCYFYAIGLAASMEQIRAEEPSNPFLPENQPPGANDEASGLSTR